MKTRLHRLFACFAVIAGLALPAAAAPIGWSVDVLTGNLVKLDLGTGSLTTVGATGFPVIRSLAFSSSGALFGIDQLGAQLLSIDPGTGATAVVGPLGSGTAGIGGLVFDAAGTLYYADEFNENLYTVNTATGAASLVGSMGQSVTGLAFRADGTLFGYADNPDNTLVTINKLTGLATTVGAIGLVSPDGGIAFDDAGQLWAVFQSGQYGIVNQATGAVALNGSFAGVQLSALDIQLQPAAGVPEPTSIGLVALSALGLLSHRRRRRRAA